MVYAVMAAQEDPSFLDTDHTPLSPASRQQLVEMIRILRDREPSAVLLRWIAQQPALSQALAHPI